MNETGSDSTRPQGRVALLRRHGGYAICVVVDEGPFSHAEATTRAALLRPEPADSVSKREAARILGISQKGVDYLRVQGLLTSEKDDRGRVRIHKASVDAELERRNATG